MSTTPTAPAGTARDTETRRRLPQLEGGVFLTEGGLETELVFLHGIDLPDFASFPLVESADGSTLLHDYYESFVDIARRARTGLVFETPTWRASADWGARLGYSTEDLDRVNRRAVELVRRVAGEHPDVTVVVSGNLGPRGDGYQVAEVMTPEQAADYHRPQIASLSGAGADMIAALTITTVQEATGIVVAAREHDMPVAISFTVETDGRLPSGTGLADAIRAVDAASGGGPDYYMVNCAHPSHFVDVLAEPGPWDRLRGVRANASTMSHDELDAATELDDGDPHELAGSALALRELLPDLAVVGGCCGTDRRHIDALGAAYSAA